jgi:hypothetical protein
MGFGRYLNNYLLAPFDLQLARSSDLAALKERSKRAERAERTLDRLRSQLSAQFNDIQCDQESFLQLARLFSPRAADGHRKVRVGRENDGGYVMLDDFDDVVAAFSFGINDDPAGGPQLSISFPELGVQPRSMVAPPPAGRPCSS